MRSRDQVEEFQSNMSFTIIMRKEDKICHHFWKWGIRNLNFLSESFYISVKWETRFSPENEWEGIRVRQLRD